MQNNYPLKSFNPHENLVFFLFVVKPFKFQLISYTIFSICCILLFANKKVFACVDQKKRERHNHCSKQTNSNSQMTERRHQKL